MEEGGGNAAAAPASHPSSSSRQPLLLAYLVVSAVVSATVVWGNHRVALARTARQLNQWWHARRRRPQRERDNRHAHAAASGAPHHPGLVMPLPPLSRQRSQKKATSAQHVTDLLAFVCFLNALVGYVAPFHWIDLEVIATNNFSETKMQATPINSLGVAILFVFLSACTLATSAYFTWHCYLLGRTLAGRPKPALALRVLMHVYVVAVVGTWFVSNANTQVHLRRLAFYRLFGRAENVDYAVPFFVRLAFGMSCTVSYIFVSMIMIWAFSRTLSSLAAHAEQNQVFDTRRIMELRSLALKSLGYVSLSLVMYIYMLFVFLVYPVNVQLAEWTTSYQLAMLLSLQVCFNSKWLPFCGKRPRKERRKKVEQQQRAAGPNVEGNDDEAKEEEKEEEEMEIMADEENDKKAEEEGTEDKGPPSTYARASAFFSRRQQRHQPEPFALPLSARQEMVDLATAAHEEGAQPRPSPADRSSWQVWQLPEVEYVYDSNEWDAAEPGVVYRVSEALEGSVSKVSASKSWGGTKGEEGT